MKPRLPTAPTPALPALGLLHHWSDGRGRPSVSSAGRGVRGAVSPALPSQPGGRPTGKGRFTRPFSTAGLACHTLLGHRGAPGKAPERRGHSVGPKGWRRGSRECFKSRPMLRRWGRAREGARGDGDEPVHRFPRDGTPALAVSPPTVSARLWPRGTLPLAAPLPVPGPAALSFLQTFVSVSADCSVFRSLRAGLCLRSDWPTSVPGSGLRPVPSLKGHRQDGLGTGLWSAGLPPG